MKPLYVEEVSPDVYERLKRGEQVTMWLREPAPDGIKLGEGDRMLLLEDNSGRFTGRQLRGEVLGRYGDAVYVRAIKARPSHSLLGAVGRFFRRLSIHI